MNQPLIMVMGLDPEIHEMPPLLMHHLRKMQKDFIISFDSEPPEKYKDALDRVGFVPTPKPKVVKPNANIIKPD